MTAGINLPGGAVHDIAVLSLRDGSGKAIPAQFETTATWADGSVRRVLIDFSANCAPNGSAVYTLNDRGVGQEEESPLKVSRTDELITVETGVMWDHKFKDDKTLQRRCEWAAHDGFEYMGRQYPGSGPIYLEAKPITMVTGGGHQYTAWKQHGGWK